MDHDVQDAVALARAAVGISKETNRAVGLLGERMLKLESGQRSSTNTSRVTVVVACITALSVVVSAWLQKPGATPAQVTASTERAVERNDDLAQRVADRVAPAVVTSIRAQIEAEYAVKFAELKRDLGRELQQRRP